MLMFFIAMLAIAAAVAAPLISFRIRRDREEELIHRGVQYSRAVRRYFKKFGRYPLRIEELEGANNIRFLRRRYKDPVSGQDFKLLHFGEVKISFGPGIIGATSPGAPVGGRTGTQSALATTAAVTNSPSSPNPNPSQSGDSSPSSAQGNPAQGGTGTSSSNTASASGDPSGQVFGGGPIVGVASVSQAETIREFNKKNHYNDWQFIYDPGTDRGGLLNTPAQPPLQSAVGPGTGPAGFGTQAGPGTLTSPGVPVQPPPQPPPNQQQ
jgi:type II secretory pathway pseudopilin PulG